MTARRSRRGLSWTAIPARDAASAPMSAASTAVRKNKYGAKRTSCHAGHSHASRKEAGRCNELHLLQKSGHISELQVEPLFLFTIDGRQIKHPNGRRVGYKPDFAYRENGRKVAEDVKSRATMTEAATLRIAIFRALYPDVDLRIV